MVFKSYVVTQRCVKKKNTTLTSSVMVCVSHIIFCRYDIPIAPISFPRKFMELTFELT